MLRVTLAILLVGVIAAPGVFCESDPDETESIPGVYRGELWDQETNPGVVVFYFHGNKRCKTCRSIESQTLEVVREEFVNERETGQVALCILNVDEPEFAHYNADFQLVTRSVVVTMHRDKTLIGFENLDRIWELVKQPEKFAEYVETKVQTSLETVAKLETESP